MFQEVRTAKFKSNIALVCVLLKFYYLLKLYAVSLHLELPLTKELGGAKNETDVYTLQVQYFKVYKYSVVNLVGYF